MVFDKLPDNRKRNLHRIHRQDLDNPILDLAHALGDETVGFEAFEQMVRDAAARDGRVVLAERSMPILWRDHRCWSGETLRACG